MSKSITTIFLHAYRDDDADLSYLGDYSDTPGPHAIDLRDREPATPSHYNYFNPTNHHSLSDWGSVAEHIKEQVIAEFGDLEQANAAYRERDFQRVRAFEKDEWYSMGIQAVAEIEVAGSHILIQSPGLYGTESDSGEEYIRAIAEEQAEELADILRELGFTDTEITAARSTAKLIISPEGK